MSHSPSLEAQQPDAERAACEATNQIRVGTSAPPPLTPYTESELIEMWGGKTEPVVSILCPTHNHREFISKTLDGFLGQRTSFPFEVIVRDDASTDGTSEILCEYATRYPMVVRPIIEPHNTFSRGFSFLPPLANKARGSLVATCGGDDYWIDAQKLQAQMKVMSRSPDVPLVSTGSVTIVDGKVAALVDVDLSTTKPSKRHAMSFVSTWLLRRDQVDLTSATYNEILCEDLLIKSQADVAGDSMHIGHRVTTARHSHAESIWGGEGGRNSHYKTLQIVNSWLWIAEHHRRHGRSRAASRPMRSAAGRWIDYLESIGGRQSLAFWVAMGLIGVKRCLLRRQRRSPDR